MTTRHLTTTTSEAWKTLSRILRNLPEAVDIVNREIDILDGMPTQHIGASAPSTPRAAALTGTCTTPVRIDHADDDGYFMDVCGDPRPCRHHDTPITLTSVESAASRLAGQTNLIDRWTRKARKIDELCSDLEREIMRAIPKKETALCNGGQGREGHMEGAKGWGSTNCGALVDIEGMCNTHIEDERQWRAANGKAERIIERGYLEQRNLTQARNGRFTAA